MICDECQALYEEVGDLARQSGRFGKVRRTDLALICLARTPEAEAAYRVEVADNHQVVYVGLFTTNRWLSESIETDLLHTGDEIEELLEEELAEIKSPAGAKAAPAAESPKVEHFRNDELEFVFRTPIALPKGEELDGEQMIQRVSRMLMAYEATFGQLGDLKADD